MRVAISGQDVYAADTWNGRVQWFTLAGEWKGTAPGPIGLRGLAVSPDRTVWVADTGNHRIAMYDRTLAPRGSVGRKGSGAGEFVALLLVLSARESGRRYFVDFSRQYETLVEHTTAIARAIEGYVSRGVPPGQVFILSSGWIDPRNLAFELGDPEWRAQRDARRIRPAPPGSSPARFRLPRQRPSRT